MTPVCPFPYYGGKSRWAPLVWNRLGNPNVYVEPFAGSLAVLLARPDGPGPREVTCDLDGGLCNFWRAVSADPEAVAYWADYPTIHQDLTARHTWLRRWLSENADWLSEDPEYCDAKAAGWWVWGISLWIGGGWCQSGHRDKRPAIKDMGGGRGVSIPTGLQRQIPRCKVGGEGVAAQRQQIAHIASESGGRGVSAQRRRRQALIEWFSRLQERLMAVVVLNRSWEAAVTPTVLQQTESGPRPVVGILMDPPYRLSTGRHSELYQSDITGESEDVAIQSFQWAVQHGDVYRIAYCAHEGDFGMPEGWTAVSRDFAGIRKAARRRERKEIVMFSPACIRPTEVEYQRSFW